MTLTAELCRKIAAVDADSLGEREYAVARQLVLDGIGVAVAGANMEPAPTILAAYFRDQGGTATSSLLGLGFGLPAAQAALVNGASMHVLDFEPMWKPGTHALSPALATVLALAESRGVAGRELACALMKGIEIQCRVRNAYRSVESRNLRFHPPGVVGPLGAVVAAAHLLKFDADRLAIAMGIASSRCGSLFSNLGTMTKSSHCGYAAALGLEAALLAERGFTGDAAMFDARTQGYVQGFMPADFDFDSLLRFGEPYRAVDPGYAIKLFPAKFSTHYGITAALALHPRIGSPDGIRAVRVVACEVPSSNRPRPDSGLAGKFSVQYTVAAALLDGHVGLQTFTDERLEKPDMQRLLPKIAFTMDPTIPSMYDAGRYADVEVELADGTVLKERCERPRGSWGAPPASADEHLAKVRSCLATFLAPTETERCVALAGNIDSLDAAEVSELIKTASGTRGPAALRKAVGQ
jgi:aconitate decarboxylase